MNSAQKVIKYVAIAFAILLSITIIKFGLDVAYIVLNSAGLVHRSESKISNVNFNELSSYLDIDLKISNLEIKKGDSFRYESNVDGLESYQDGNKLVIRDKEEKNFFNRKGSYVTLYVPENLVFDKVNISMGIGNLDIKDVDLNDVTLDLGIGKTNIESNLKGINKLECGIGKINLNLSLDKDEYTFKLKKGIGKIDLNGETIDNDNNIGNGLNIIDVDGGIGKISIYTK